MSAPKPGPPRNSRRPPTPTPRPTAPLRRDAGPRKVYSVQLPREASPKPGARTQPTSDARPRQSRQGPTLPGLEAAITAAERSPDKRNALTTFVRESDAEAFLNFIVTRGDLAVRMFAANPNLSNAQLDQAQVAFHIAGQLRQAARAFRAVEDALEPESSPDVPLDDVVSTFVRFGGPAIRDVTRLVMREDRGPDRVRSVTRELTKQPTRDAQLVVDLLRTVPLPSHERTL